VRLVASAVVPSAAATSTAATAASTATTTSPATTATATAAGTRLARPGLVHRQTTAFVFVVIEGFDCRTRLGIATHLDKSEALAPACVAIGDNLRALNAAVL
jgi:hypothetical protein